jgi:uncharacterized protein YgbK (DUF1537 family)
MYIAGVPLDETFKRFDPVTPMTNANLVEWLQVQSRPKVGLLRRSILLEGRDAAEAELDRQGDAAFFIVDAVDRADIGRIADLTFDWPLTTGADSLPPALARRWRAGRPAEAGSGRRRLPPSPGYEAVLAGSCAAPTLAQLEAFEQAHPVWRIDLVRDGEDPDLVDRIADWASDRLRSGPVAIATSATREGVVAAQARYGRDGAAALSDRLMGSLAPRLSALGVRNFVVAGGETSGEVLAALGVRRVQVATLDEMQGGYCHQSEPAKTSFVLKPGSFGDRNFFFAALTRMREANLADGQNQTGEKP